jgi:regulator of protease activity HflC (stomatin/prohibitin superfamily)
MSNDIWQNINQSKIKEENKMAETNEKDWRLVNVEKTKARFEKWRKIFLAPLCIGALFLVIAWFTPLKTTIWLIAASVFCVLPWYATYCFKTVKAWERGVVFFFGRLYGTPEKPSDKSLRKPGPRWIWWPFETIRFVKVYERKLDIPPQEVIVQEEIVQRSDVGPEKNPIIITVDSVFWFKVTDAVSSITVIEDVEGALTQLFIATLREKCSGVDLQKLIGNRDEIVKAVLDAIAKTLGGEGDKKGWGVEVTKLGLQDVRPPEDIKQALHGVFKADKTRKEQIIGGEAEGQRRKKVADGEEYSIDKISDAQARRFDKFQKVDPRLGALALDTAGKITPNKIILIGKDLGDAAKNLSSLSGLSKKPESSDS